MGQSPLDFAFHTWQDLDLMAIGRMSPYEQQETLARYTKLRDDLSTLLAEQRAALTLTPPGYWQMRQFSKLMRKHRSAELAVERLQKAIDPEEQER